MMRRRLVLPLIGAAILAASCEASGAPANGAGDHPAGEASVGERSALAAARSDAGDPGSRVTGGYTLGRPDAPVAVVEFSDFGCPYCGRFARTTLPEIRRDYIREGLVRWRYVPVTFGFPGGVVMAAAAVCAGEVSGEEGFWEAHDVFYRHQTALRGEDARERALDYLDEAGLNADRIATCMEAPETARTMAEYNQLAREWFVNGTPSFVINGVPMSGAMPTEFFRKVFDTALDPAGL